MAKQTYTLTQKQAQQMPEIARRVLGNGPSTATTPYNGSTQDLWVGLVDYDLRDGDYTGGENYFWTYAGAIFASPFADDPIPGSSGTIAILNTWEVGNKSSRASGYDIVTSNQHCGDIIGVSALPIDCKQKYLARGPYKYKGSWFYAITDRNDPIIKGP